MRKGEGHIVAAARLQLVRTGGATRCGPRCEIEAAFDLITLTFDLSTSKWGSRVIRIMGFLPVNFQLNLDLGSFTGQRDRQTTAINS